MCLSCPTRAVTSLHTRVAAGCGAGDSEAPTPGFGQGAGLRRAMQLSGKGEGACGGAYHRAAAGSPRGRGRHRRRLRCCRRRAGRHDCKWHAPGCRRRADRRGRLNLPREREDASGRASMFIFHIHFPLFISAVRVQNFPRLRRSWDCRRVMDGRRWSSVHGQEKVLGWRGVRNGNGNGNEKWKVEEALRRTRTSVADVAPCDATRALEEAAPT